LLFLFLTFIGESATGFLTSGGTSLRQFSLKLNHAIGVLPEPPNIFPPEGLLPRCRHHVYWPESFRAKEISNPGCTFCTPPSDDFEAERIAAARFHMPTACNDPLNGFNPERSNARQPGACPQCFSMLHFTKTEDGKGDFECADCGTVFRPTLSYHQKVLAVQAAAEAA
jgi:hypothetical protein